MYNCSERVGHSSQTTRKIDSLRRMAQRLKSGKELYDVNYFFTIADEMERVYRNLIEARKALIEIQELSVDRISTRSALEKTAKIVGRVVGSPR